MMHTCSEDIDVLLPQQLPLSPLREVIQERGLDGRLVFSLKEGSFHFRFVKTSVDSPPRNKKDDCIRECTQGKKRWIVADITKNQGALRKYQEGLRSIRKQVRVNNRISFSVKEDLKTNNIQTSFLQDNMSLQIGGQPFLIDACINMSLSKIMCKYTNPTCSPRKLTGSKLKEFTTFLNRS